MQDDISKNNAATQGMIRMFKRNVKTEGKQKPRDPSGKDGPGHQVRE